MAFFWKKEQKIISKIEKYLELVIQAKSFFFTTIEELIKTPIEKRKIDSVEKLHQYESLADDIRREIEYDLYNKALLPEIRGEILSIMESMDKIPNRFQSICYQIFLQRIEIPEIIHSSLFHLINENLETVDFIIKATSGFYYKKDIFSLLQEVDKAESLCDHIERDLIHQVFQLDINRADMILLKEVIVQIGLISDKAETVADKLTITIIKRRP
ncbi:MAG: DUF47 family protein [Spirochaetales bacterium]|nr:DUF47 family protein [Spirochaetales bacterium]